jgi:hypothetical protein
MLYEWLSANRLTALALELEAAWMTAPQIALTLVKTIALLAELCR